MPDRANDAPLVPFPAIPVRMNKRAMTLLTMVVLGAACDTAPEFQRSAAAATQLRPCSNDGDCATGSYCDGGWCRPRLDCTTNKQCDERSYCAFKVGLCAEPASCAPRPTSCAPDFIPVCGCNGWTYDNACMAAAAGTGVAFAGACPVHLCGSNAECPAGSYCAFKIGACAPPGVCTPRPTTCPSTLDPVCGCDGKPYNNACMAAYETVSLTGTAACFGP
jgi:hypothetical protein